MKTHPIKEDRELTHRIFARSRKRRNESGKMIIPSPLSVDERQAINERLKHLMAGLEKASPQQLKTCVAELLKPNEPRAKDICARFAKVLKGLPFFAVKRACDRVRNGGVQPGEVGEAEPLPSEWRPNVYQLRQLAEAIIAPYWDEQAVAALLLEAEVDRRATEGTDRASGAARVASALAEHKSAVRASEAEIQASRAKGRAITDAKLRADHAGRLVSAYYAQGLEPVYADPDQKIPLSIEFMRANAWSRLRNAKPTVSPSSGRTRDANGD